MCQRTPSTACCRSDALFLCWTWITRSFTAPLTGPQRPSSDRTCVCVWFSVSPLFVCVFLSLSLCVVCVCTVWVRDVSGLCEMYHVCGERAACDTWRNRSELSIERRVAVIGRMRKPVRISLFFCVVSVCFSLSMCVLCTVGCYCVMLVPLVWSGGMSVYWCVCGELVG